MATETIFNESAGLEAHDDNGAPVLKNNDDGGNITTGTAFTPLLADIYAIGVKWWAPTSSLAFNPIAGLFEMTIEEAGIELARATFASITQGSWDNEVLFEDPVLLEVGTYYAVGVYSNKYVATGNYAPFGFSGGYTSGTMVKAIQNNSPFKNGRFAFGPSDLAYPNSSFNSGYYYVDVIVTDFAESGGTTKSSFMTFF